MAIEVNKYDAKKGDSFELAKKKTVKMDLKHTHTHTHAYARVHDSQGHAQVLWAAEIRRVTATNIGRRLDPLC